MPATKIVLALLLFFNFSLFTFAKKNPMPKNSDVLKSFGKIKGKNKLNPDKIKLLVWNMYKGDKPSWEKDFRYLWRDHDIFALQEMFLDKKMKSVFNNHKDNEYHSATAFHYTSRNNIETGVATASHVRSTKTFWQRSKGREPIIKTPKMVIFTRYPIEGSNKELLVANIHAINFVGAETLGNQIREVANEIKMHNGPAIFAGDFNTWSSSKVMVMFGILNKIGMKRVKFNPKWDKRMKVNGYFLDYIWYKKLEVLNSTVWGYIEGSDHKAMSAEFKVAY